MRSKVPSRGLWMPELVLHGIRELAEQFLGPLLDIEVDHSDFRAAVSFHPATTFIAENVNKEKLYEVRPPIYFLRNG